jgi:hypothetical protein
MPDGLYLSSFAQSRERFGLVSAKMAIFTAIACDYVGWAEFDRAHNERGSSEQGIGECEAVGTMKPCPPLSINAK